MEHQQIRTLFGQHLTQLVARPGDLPVTPRPYQVETLDSTARWLLNPDGTRRGYVVHATGLGKTVIFASMVAAASGMRSLVIVPTKLLLVQTARVIARFTGGVLGHLSSLAHIQDDSGETIAIRGLDHSPIVLTTDASFNKLATSIKRDFDPHIIIRDECHWGYIDSALAALDEFPEAAIIAFSATPDFLTNAARDGYTPVTLENGQVLYGPRDRFAETHFQTCLDRRTTRWGIESGWLCPLAWGRIEFDVPLKEVRVVETPDGADYDQSELQKLMGKHWSVMCETVRRLYENHEYELADRQAYAVCPSVEAAQELAEAVNSLGIPAACVTGTTPDTERDILLQAYQENEIRFLTSVMVLREGWDAPNAEVCMMLRPTKSRVLYEQAMGRVLRPRVDGENKVALVLDAHFQSQTFYPLSAPELYAKPGDEIRIGDVLIGGGGGGVRGGESDSPYLPKDAQPRLVVVEMFSSATTESQELKTGRDGTVLFNGKCLATLGAIVKILQLSHETLKKRVLAAELTSIQGRDSVGKQAQLYVLEEVKQACGELVSHLPEAHEDGLVRIKGREFAPTKLLGELVNKDQATVKTLVARKNLKPVRGRDRMGRVTVFYNVQEFKDACTEELKELPTIGVDCARNSDSTFTLDRQVMCTVQVFMNLSGLSRRAINDRMRKSGSEPVQFRDKLGRVFEAHKLQVFQLACQDLLGAQLLAQEDGSIVYSGKRFVQVSKIATELQVSQPYVVSVIQKHRVASVSGTGSSHRIGTFFDIEAVRALMSEKINMALRLDTSGIVEVSGATWTTYTRSSSMLHVSTDALKRALAKESSPPTMKVLDQSGHVVTVYPLDYLRNICARLTEITHVVDEQGFITIEGKVWGTIRALMKLLKVGDVRLWSSIAKAGLTGCKARKPSGEVVYIHEVEAVTAALKARS